MREEDRAKGIIWNEEDLAEHLVIKETVTTEEIIDMIKQKAHQSTERTGAPEIR